MLKSSFNLVLSGSRCPSCSLLGMKLRNPLTLTSRIHQQAESLSSISDEFQSKDESSNSQHPYKNIYPWKSKLEFVEHLVQEIVHTDDGLVVINKPFGVGVINSKAKKGQQIQFSHLRGIAQTDYSLEMALPHLRTALNKPDLVLVKSTERMTSGIAVFADNAQHGDKFRRKLRNAKGTSNIKPLYNYLVITTGSPFTNQTTFHERVGIHLKSALLSNVMQPCIERQFSKNSVKRQDVKPVYVTMNVAKYGDHKTALLEIGTSSVKWNFLRIYCADLLIPILGDHLYSCRVQTIMGVPAKMDISHAPPGSSDQKLSDHILKALDVSQSIHVLPHMHLQSYLLQNYHRKGHHLQLEAPVPPHFKWTQSRLNLL